MEYVRCMFIDLSGVARGRAVHRDYLASVLRRGVPFAQVNNLVDIDDLESDLAFGSQAGDFWAVPAPDTLVRLPYTRASGQMFTDLVGADGAPWPTCGRAIVRRLAATAADEIGTVGLGFEQEGYVLRRNQGRYEPVVLGKQMQGETLDLLDDFVQDLTAALQVMSVPVEKMTAEGGPGMFEVNFRQAEPLEAAERYFRFKQAFRGVARGHGMVGTFMPKPFAEGPGAGLHVHVSCAGIDGTDAFGDGRPGAGLSPLGRHFLGGLLAHAASLVALGSPSVNSYKRLQPGTWAPTHVAYGIGNRSAMVRVVEGRTDLADGTGPRRLEIRSPDGTCNPYLLTAGILAAGLDGVRRQLEPGPPVAADVARLGDLGPAAPPLRRLPATLDAALDGLESDEAVGRLIGPRAVDAYAKVKRIEWAKYMAHVSDWEHRYYAEFF
jgi:glutamine synthetase